MDQVHEVKRYPLRRVIRTANFYSSHNYECTVIESKKLFRDVVSLSVVVKRKEKEQEPDARLGGSGVWRRDV